MLEFTIIKESRKSNARLGILKTAHGEIETPAFVPVATRASVKTLTSAEAENAGSQLLIANTFHLHVYPGENVVKRAGGLHAFMSWKRPLMTDSGGFQVFSLGFGKDLGIGKIMKFFPGSGEEKISRKAIPRGIKITDSGVFFRSPKDGSKLFLGPKESMRIQQALGADIIFAFDECTPPFASKEYLEESFARTERWATECLSYHDSRRQALYGIVQGSRYKRMREEAARYIAGLDFEGYGIGGDLGRTKAELSKILDWTVPHLDPRKPRHILGVGYLEDMERIIKSGADTFDCIVPTHYARHGVAFTSHGKLDMRKSIFLNDNQPLDKKCECPTCLSYKRSYITHLLRAHEITGLRLLSEHNLFFFNLHAKKIRDKIKAGKL